MSVMSTLFICVIVSLVHCPSVAGLLVFEGILPDSPDLPELVYSCCIEPGWHIKSKLTCSTENVAVTPLTDLVNNISQTTQFKLTLLTVRDTLLTDLPVNICRLKLVEELDLSNNKLTKISPSNCFTGMENLRKLDLSRNLIEILPEGIFDDLQQLEYLNISRNYVLRFIDLRVFSNASELISLRTIDLALNSISSLEPWPLIRGQVVPGCSVNFDRNEIETFTNSLKFRYRCGMQPIHMSLNLRKNKVKLFTDIMDGWGFSRKVDFLCLFGNNGDESLFELILKSTGMICDCRDYAIFNFLKRTHSTGK